MTCGRTKYVPVVNTPLNPLLLEGTSYLPSNHRGWGGVSEQQNVLILYKSVKPNF